MNYKQLPWEVKLQLGIQNKFSSEHRVTEEEIEKLLEERLDLKKLVIKHMMEKGNDKENHTGRIGYSAINSSWSSV